MCMQVDRALLLVCHRKAQYHLKHDCLSVIMRVVVYINPTSSLLNFVDCRVSSTSRFYVSIDLCLLSHGSNISTK